MTKKAKGVLDLEGDGKVRRLAVVPAKVSKSSRVTAAKAEEGGTQVAKKKKPKKRGREVCQAEDPILPDNVKRIISNANNVKSMNVSAEAAASGKPTMGVDQGDCFSDVVKFWTFVCINPSFLTTETLQWDIGTSFVLKYSVAAIYDKFASFICRKAKEEEDVREKLNDEGVELRDKDGVGVFEVFPDVLEEGEVDAPFVVTMAESKADASCEESPKAAHTKQSDFWNISKYLIGAEINKTSGSVTLPCRFAVTQTLKRLGQRMSIATGLLAPRLEQVPAAYSDEAWHRLHWIITPNCIKGIDKDSFSVSFYDVSNGVYDSSSQVQRVTFGNIVVNSHPMFQKKCWSDMLFLVIVLAYTKGIYINFKFQVGLNYQYVNVYEQLFEILHEEEISDVNGYHNGARVTQIKSIIDGDDYQSGRTPIWLYEFDIPDSLENGVSKSIPSYNGVKVRLMFRNDQSDWFF